MIEDDPQIRRFLRTALETHGFEVVEAANGKQGINETKIRKADLIILDLGLPYTEGVEVVRAVRTWSEIPIIVLWAHGAEADKIQAFNAGANDSLIKPFGLSKLLDRIYVALSHASVSHAPTETAVFVTGNLRVDLLNRRVYNGDQEIRLTPIQYRLLAVLIKQAGKVVTNQQILNEVWGANPIESPHYLRIYISQLRHKIETDPAQPKYLLTESGVGYRLKV